MFFECFALDRCAACASDQVVCAFRVNCVCLQQISADRVHPQRRDSFAAGPQLSSGRQHVLSDDLHPVRNLPLGGTESPSAPFRSERLVHSTFVAKALPPSTQSSERHLSSMYIVHASWDLGFRTLGPVRIGPYHYVKEALPLGIRLNSELMAISQTTRCSIFYESGMLSK